MSLAQLIIPSGVAAFAFLAAAAAAGIVMFKFNVSWINMKVHMWLGAGALIFGTIHVILVNLF